jgi:hypothetical protein
MKTYYPYIKTKELDFLFKYLQAISGRKFIMAEIGKVFTYKPFLLYDIFSIDKNGKKKKILTLTLNAKTGKLI